MLPSWRTYASQHEKLSEYQVRRFLECFSSSGLHIDSRAKEISYYVLLIRYQACTYKLFLQQVSTKELSTKHQISSGKSYTKPYPLHPILNALILVASRLQKLIRCNN